MIDPGYYFKLIKEYAESKAYDNTVKLEKIAEAVEGYFQNKDEEKPKENILQEADRITSSDRAKAYGPAKESFKRIAMMWGAYKNVYFDENDVAMMMILLKISRQSFKPKRDNLVDIAGYARTGEMLNES